MPRRRRYIRAGRPFELEIRVREGLPFACRKVIKLLLQSAMARAQRDNKVTICHFEWQGNHLHMMLIPHDAEQCIFFFQELQKKITEYMKKLLGLRRLALWEGDPIFAEVLDEDYAMDRIAYYYANPSTADLVETIDDYPGCSTWKEFLEVEESVTASSTTIVPWIRLPTIEKLPSLTLSDEMDHELCEQLKSSNKKLHPLTIYPHAWLAAFGSTAPEEVQEAKREIIRRVRDREAANRERRLAEKKSILGLQRLLREPIMKPHTPPPRERRVHTLSSSVELRVQHIEAMKSFDELCARCHREWKNGNTSIAWPPGAIRPALRPVANAVAPLEELMADYELER